MRAEHCRRRRRQLRHVLDRMSGATAAGSLAAGGRYASGEVVQVRRARGGESGILDPIATPKTEECGPTRYRSRIVCEGQVHVSVAGYQRDGEGSAGIRHNYIRRGGGGTMAHLSPYRRPLVHAPRYTFRRLLCRRFLYLQLLTAVALRYNPHARDRLRAAAAAAAAARLCCRFSCFFHGFLVPLSRRLGHPRFPDQTSREQRERVPSRSSSPPPSPSPSPRMHLAPHLRVLCMSNLRSTAKCSFALRKHGKGCGKNVGWHQHQKMSLHAVQADFSVHYRAQNTRWGVRVPSSVGYTTIE